MSTARSIYAEWAWRVIESYILRNEYPGIPADMSKELTQRRAACFVTIHKTNGDLRGCIGTILPTKQNLAEEIRDNAIAAATKDPRFPSVRPEELGDLVISVDVLSEPEECKPEDLNPKKYGVIVEAGWRRGVLLPDLPGINTVQEQLRIALLKAGISPNEPYKIFRFSATRYY